MLVMILGHLSLSFALIVFQIGKEKSHTLWPSTLAKLLQVVAWALLYAAQSHPGSILAQIGSCGLLTGLAVDAGAMWLWARRPDWPRVILPLLFALILLVVALPTLLAMPGAAALGLALGVAMLCVAAGLALFPDWVQATALRRVLAVCIIGIALCIAINAFLDWRNGRADQLMTLNTVVSLYLFALMNGFGMLLLTREEQESDLTRLATIDPLSGVPNRRGFFNALAPWMALARRPGQPTSIIVLDLDHFKRIKENYGHAVGELVIRTMVEIGQRQLRDSDLIGRLGGEEFAILLPRTDVADAVVVAERIRNAIMAAPVKTERAVIYTTASFGLTTIRADDDAVALFKRADEARLQAKKLGGNRVAEAAPGAEMAF
ncbi:MAG: GGDEF domain-containing protein [Pseudomonadota bacterium]